MRRFTGDDLPLTGQRPKCNKRSASVDGKTAEPCESVNPLWGRCRLPQGHEGRHDNGYGLKWGLFNLLKGPVEFDYDPNDDKPDGTLDDESSDEPAWERGFCGSCSKMREQAHEGICVDCWRYYVLRDTTPDAGDAAPAKAEADRASAAQGTTGEVASVSAHDASDGDELVYGLSVVDRVQRAYNNLGKGPTETEVGVLLTVIDQLRQRPAASAPTDELHATIARQNTQLFEAGRLRDRYREGLQRVKNYMVNTMPVLDFVNEALSDEGQS